MQDTRTGILVELESDVAQRALKEEVKRSFKDRMKTLGMNEEYLRSRGIAAGIPAEHQCPVFCIDEEVTVKGGRFRVRGFEGGLLHLEGIPRA